MNCRISLSLPVLNASVLAEHKPVSSEECLRHAGANTLERIGFTNTRNLTRRHCPPKSADGSANLCGGESRWPAASLSGGNSGRCSNGGLCRFLAGNPLKCKGVCASCRFPSLDPDKFCTKTSAISPLKTWRDAVHFRCNNMEILRRTFLPF